MYSCIFFFTSINIHTFLHIQELVTLLCAALRPPLEYNNVRCWTPITDGSTDEREYDNVSTDVRTDIENEFEWAVRSDKKDAPRYSVIRNKFNTTGRTTSPRIICILFHLF
jgi:hypothetical protein